MADTTTGDYNDGGLEAASELAANKAYADAVTRLNGQRLNTLQGAGYMGDIDPTTGTVGNLRVDPNNPYGDYQSLLRTGARQSEATHDQLAGRGIGGGLAQHAEQDNQYAFGAGSNQLGTSLQQSLGGYDQAQLGAGSDRDQNVLNARTNAAQSALQYQLQNALLALPGSIAAQLANSPAGQGGAPDPGPVQGNDMGQGPNYAPNPVLAKAVGGKYTTGGGATYYQSNKGNYGSKPLY